MGRRGRFGFLHVAAALCLLWCAAATAIVAARLAQSPSPIDTDIQSMLPEDARDPVLRAALLKAGEAASGRLAVLVKADSSGAAAEAAESLRAALVQTGLFVSDAADAEATGRWLFANRNALLCEAEADAFDATAAERVARGALAALYAPTTPVSGELLAADPFLLTLRLSQCLAPGPPASPDTAALVSGRLTESAFRLDTQAQVIAAIDDWRVQSPGVTIARAGAVFHADAAATRAKAEVALIGGIGGLGVIVLFWIAFRRLVSVAIAVACVYVGLAGGLAAALVAFPRVHVLVFVFGATLIGVVSDYAVHFLATGPATRWTAMRERLRLVARPVTVSMITTGLAFAAMAFFSAPLFAQVAVFAAAGLVTAWAFVLAVLPFIDAKPRNGEALAMHWRRLEDARARIVVPPVWSAIAALAIVASAVWGATHVRFLDDPRAFQPRETALLAEEREIRAAGESAFAPAFLLSEGATPDAARRVEEAAFAALGAPRDLLAVSRFDPSVERRAAAAARLDQLLFRERLPAHLKAIGLDPAVVDHQRADADAAPPAWLGAWRGEAHGKHFLVAPILDDAVPDAALPPGARIVVPATHYAAVFAAYRGYASFALVAATLAAAGIVVLAYRRFAALAVMAAPLAGVAAGLALPAALGEPISFFSLVAALVLLGVGIDYSAFQWEAGRGGHHDRWTAVALPIDAATTALSMGLLMFSATEPLRNFGLTITVGVAAALIFSYVPRKVSARLSAPGTKQEDASA